MKAGKKEEIIEIKCVFGVVITALRPADEVDALQL